MTSMPLEELVGLPLTSVVGPTHGTERAVAALESGELDSLSSRRVLLRRGQKPMSVSVWTRAVQMPGRRDAASIWLPDSELGAIRRDPSRPWRDLASVVTGVVDRAWRIHDLSEDVGYLLGGNPSEWVGRSVLDAVHPADLARAADCPVRPPSGPQSWCRLRLRTLGGEWAEVCMLLAPLSESTEELLVFAIVGRAHTLPPAPVDRVAELESRLRRIGLEIQAAGVSDAVNGLRTAREFPQLGELTGRQWEILSRLLDGERVASIASSLFLTPSTVRNHLAAIFRRFAVHSQAELIELLKSPPTDLD